MDIDAYRGLEPIQLWRHFAALNAIPRPSGHEGRAREYVLHVAEAASAHSRVDARGNAIVRVPPSAGGGGPVVAVQAHLDMVCEKESDVVHDCERDSIIPRREGDQIFASGTTLGADNGIGVAACLALISTPNVCHGGLELIFTVDEEHGPWGALDLDASSLSAQALINLDSEDADALTIGSAGGSDVDLAVPVSRESPASDLLGVELRLSGLRGGHSGLQIHEPRANALKVIGDALEKLRGAGLGVRLVSLEGGSAHNAIPRVATASLGIAPDALPEAGVLVKNLLGELREPWASAEPGLALELTEGLTPTSVLAEDAVTRISSLLHELPHGVLERSTRFHDTVETSANLAAIRIGHVEAEILTSVRSLSAARLVEIQEGIRELAVASGAHAEINDEYPAWEPRERSPLLKAAVAAYQGVYGREPRLDVLHGGLECGVIIAKKPDLDAVSFGPLIREAHTPAEHVYASTVATTWELLVALLGRLAG